MLLACRHRRFGDVGTGSGRDSRPGSGGGARGAGEPWLLEQRKGLGFLGSEVRTSRQVSRYRPDRLPLPRRSWQSRLGAPCWLAKCHKQVRMMIMRRWISGWWRSTNPALARSKFAPMIPPHGNRSTCGRDGLLGQELINHWVVVRYPKRQATYTIAANQTLRIRNKSSSQPSWRLSHLSPSR